MSDEPELTLGVLGGMGPAATVDFLAKLISVTDAEREQDHLRVLVDCNPKVPDRNAAMTTDGPSPGPVLAAMAAGLARAGAGFLVMACNAAHEYEADIRAAIDVPFVGIVSETVDALEREHPGASRFGVLAAQATMDAGLYQRALASRSLEAIVLDAADQRRFMALLYRVKLGELSTEIRDAMRDFAQTLVARGAEVVVAACTEVPLVLDAGSLTRPLLDPTLNLARRCVRYARRLEPLPDVRSATT